MKYSIAFAAALVSSIATAAELQFDNPYVQANVPGTANTVGYMTVSNHSAQDVAIIGVESAVAKKVELHSHVMEGDLMKMRMIESIDVAAGDTVHLAPNAHHVMFINLTQQLKPEEQVSITFQYDDGTRQDVELLVVDPRKMKMNNHQHGDHQHHDHKGHKHEEHHH